MLNSFTYWYKDEKIFKYLNKYSLMHFQNSVIANTGLFCNIRSIDKYNKI